MEMDWGTATIGAVFLSTFLVPLVLMNFKRKAKDKKMLQSLIDLAHKQNCSIIQHELCGDFVIGSDESKKTVFFYKEKKDEAIALSVNLAEIQSCRTINTSQNSKSEGGGLLGIDKIELCFTPKDKSKPEVKFELYCRKENIQLSGELQLATKWQDHLNELIKRK